GSWAGLRVDWLHGEAFLQDLRGSIYIVAAELHLLHAFSKFRQVASNGALPAGIACRQYVQRSIVRKVQLEFFGVLVRRHARQRRQAVGFQTTSEGSSPYCLAPN